MNKPDEPDKPDKPGANTALTQTVKSMTLEAVVTRADGTVEDLGVIASYAAPTPTPTPPTRALLKKLRTLLRRRNTK